MFIILLVLTIVYVNTNNLNVRFHFELIDLCVYNIRIERIYNIHETIRNFVIK